MKINKLWTKKFYNIGPWLLFNAFRGDSSFVGEGVNRAGSFPATGEAIGLGVDPALNPNRLRG